MCHTAYAEDTKTEVVCTRNLLKLNTEPSISWLLNTLLKFGCRGISKQGHLTLYLFKYVFQNSSNNAGRMSMCHAYKFKSTCIVKTHSHSKYYNRMCLWNTIPIIMTWVKVKVTLWCDGQTDIKTCNMPQIIWFGGIKVSDVPYNMAWKWERKSIRPKQNFTYWKSLTIHGRCIFA